MLNSMLFTDLSNNIDTELVSIKRWHCRPSTAVPATRYDKL